MSTRGALPWALILAGGEGRRLRFLTRQIVGDPRPKQFCPMLDGETLLERTRRRAELLARPDQVAVVVTGAHETYYRGLDRDLAPGRLVVQPANRGTGAGILYPLLRLRHLAGNVPLVVVPSDHHVSDEAAFVQYMATAVDLVHARRDLVVLLGIEATAPETEYGWIETGAIPLPLDGEPAFPVRRFWEKPSVPLAERLFQRGALWNSFVMIGWVDAFLRLVWENAPDLVIAFDEVRRALGTEDEGAAVQRAYGTIVDANFSDRVLVPGADHLAVIRVKGVEWSDWGNAERVLATIRRTGWRPDWLGRVVLARTG